MSTASGEVSTGSGSDRVAAYSENRDCEDGYPVATAPGTDSMIAAGDDRQTNSETTSFELRRFSATLRWTQGHSYCNDWSVPATS